MHDTTIKFRADSFFNKKDIVKSFRRHFPTTVTKFDKATVKQSADKVGSKSFGALTLHTTDGFTIKVIGLYCGVDGAEDIVNIIRYCGFMIEDTSVIAILNCKDGIDLKFYR